MSSQAVFHSSTLMTAGLMAYCVVHVTATSQLLPKNGIVQSVAEITPEGFHIHTDPSHVVPAAQLAIAVACCNLLILYVDKVEKS